MNVREAGRHCCRNCFTMLHRVVAVLLALTFAVHCQAAEGEGVSRQARIDSLVEALARIQIPITEAMAPAIPTILANAILGQLRTQQKLGLDWKPGSPYWDEAERLLVRPIGDALQEFSGKLAADRAQRIRAQVTRWPQATIDRASAFLQSPMAVELGPDIDSVVYGSLLVLAMAADDFSRVEAIVGPTLQEQRQLGDGEKKKRPSAAFTENIIAQQIGGVVQSASVAAFIAEFDFKAVLESVRPELRRIVQDFQASRTGR